MKTLVCLAAISLLACSAPFEAADHQESFDNDPIDTGAKTPVEAPQDKEEPRNELSANLPLAGMGGNATTVAGMGGMPSAGNGSAGSGMGGDSPTAGMGSAGKPATLVNECGPEGRIGEWSEPNWNWDGSDASIPSHGKTSACVNQFDRIAKAVLDLSTPDNCVWEYDNADPETWNDCRFTNSLTCQPIVGASLTFTAHITAKVTNGRLIGSVTYEPATAGACVILANHSSGLNFTATRN